MKVVGGAISTDASRFFLQVNDTKYVFDAWTGKELTKVGVGAKHPPATAVSPDNEYS